MPEALDPDVIVANRLLFTGQLIRHGCVRYLGRLVVRAVEIPVAKLTERKRRTIMLVQTYQGFCC